MKIGWFTDTFYPQYNGVVTSLEHFGKELVERGNSIDIFCPKSDRKAVYGMKIHSVPGIPFKPYPGYKIAIPIGLKVPKLDIMHTHGPFSMGMCGLRIAKKQGIPKIGTVHTMFSEYVQYLTKSNQAQMKNIAWKYLAYHYNKYDVITTPSFAMEKELITHGIKRPVQVVPNGVDTKLLKPVGNAKKKLGLKDKKIILTLGRISYEKKLDQIISAMRDVPDAHLIVVGSGPYMDEFRRLPGKLDIRDRVTFTGFIPEEKKALYYSAADVFAMASTSETQGLVILESMACGTPVVGAKAMAIPEVVQENKNGWLYEPNNVKELSKILNAATKKKAMSKHCINTAKKFSVEKMTDKLEKLYKDL